MPTSFEDSDSETKASEEEIYTNEVHETRNKQADDEIINESEISTGNKTTNEQLLLMINNIKSSFDDFKKGFRTSRVQPEKSLAPQAYNAHLPQAYSVHPPQVREQQNNSPLSSSSSTVPYNVNEIKDNISKKRRVVHGPCTQSKKPKIVDPELSLPEESDMDNNIRDLLHNPNDSDESTLKDDNEDIDDMLQALSNEVEGLDEKGPPVRENLAKCFNNIWNKPLTKEKYVEKLKKQKMPTNLNLNIKRCNSEIWKNMVSTGAKTKDLKLQKIQTAVSKTSAGLISNANELMALGERKDKFISKKELKTIIENYNSKPH